MLEKSKKQNDILEQTISTALHTFQKCTENDMKKEEKERNKERKKEGRKV